MSKPEKETAPVRQSVLVDCPIDLAFELFTEQVAEWWPLAAHSVSGDHAADCVIEPWAGGRVYERTRSGDEHDWGTVKTWDPPKRFSLTWNPDGCGNDQTVDINFSVEADGTRVTLIHAGWAGAGVQVCAQHTNAAEQWIIVLECFARSARAATLIYA